MIDDVNHMPPEPSRSVGCCRDQVRGEVPVPRKYELGYWKTRGLAAPVRMILAHLRVEYVDTMFSLRPVGDDEAIAAASHLGTKADERRPLSLSPSPVRPPEEQAGASPAEGDGAPGGQGSATVPCCHPPPPADAVEPAVLPPPLRSLNMIPCGRIAQTETPSSGPSGRGPPHTRSGAKTAVPNGLRRPWDPKVPTPRRRTSSTPKPSTRPTSSQSAVVVKPSPRGPATPGLPSPKRAPTGPSSARGITSPRPPIPLSPRKLTVFERLSRSASCSCYENREASTKSSKSALRAQPGSSVGSHSPRSVVFPHGESSPSARIRSAGRSRSAGDLRRAVGATTSKVSHATAIAAPIQRGALPGPVARRTTRGARAVKSPACSAATAKSSHPASPPPTTSARIPLVPRATAAGKAPVAQYDRSEWSAVHDGFITSGRCAFPALPYLITPQGDIVVHQGAVVRHLARVFHFYGPDEAAKLRFDSLMEQANEFRMELSKHMYSSKYAATNKTFCNDCVHYFLTAFELHLRKMSAMWFACSELTAVDFVIFDVVCVGAYLAEPYWLIEEEFPMLSAFVDAVRRLPSLAGYFASDVARLPMNNVSAYVGNHERNSY